MKFGSWKPASAILLLALLAISGCSSPGERAQEQESILLTPEAAGPIKLGMSIGEARKAAKDWEFVRAINEDFFNPLVVEVRRDGKTVLILKALEGVWDPEAETHPINEEGEIIIIVVLDKAFRTEEGIGIGSTLVDAEKVFGKLEGMYNFPRRGETGRFSKLPEWSDFGAEAPGLNFIFESKIKETAGFYEHDPDCKPDDPLMCNVAKKYAEDTFISKIYLLPKVEE